MKRRLFALLATVIAGLLVTGGAAWANFDATATAAQLASATTLGAPATVSAAAGSTSTSMTVSVTAGPSNPSATGYTVYAAGTTTPLLCSVGTAPGHCTVSGLTPNTSYQFDVHSTLSSWTSAAKATTTSASTSKQNTTTNLSNITPTTGTAGTTSFSATATVTGNDGYGTPAGSVIFSLYTSSTCNNTASYSTSSQTLDGNGKATGSITPSAAGTYYWQAAYTAGGVDTYDSASSSACSSTSITVSSAANYSFAISAIGTQTAGTAFGGFTVQLQNNGVNTGTFNGGSYAGSHSVSFTGTAMGASPNSTPATPTSISLSFDSSGLATVPANALTLFKAQSAAVLTVTDSTNSITGSSGSFAINSGGAALGFGTSCPAGSWGNNQSWTSTITIAADAYGNPASYASPGLTFSVALTSTGNDASHWSLNSTTGPTTTTIAAAGSPTSSFTVTHLDSGKGKQGTITVSGPSGGGFTQATCSMSS